MMKMKQNSHKNNISKDGKIIIVKNAVKPFLIMTLATIVFANIILFIYNKSEIRATKDIEQNSVEMLAVGIVNNIRAISSDVFILANLKYIEDLWGVDGAINKNYLHELSENFLTISKIKKEYDQVRLLDENGLETIRINFNSGSPYIVPKEKLQNKKGRYYFEDTFNLQKDEIYISPLDLNIEHGKIEKPFKPMIRFGMPFFNKSGEKKGIVLLNYFGAKLIEQFKSSQNSTKTDNLMLLNSDGYWLSGTNSDDEWNFVSEKTKDRTFGNRHPEAWEIIRSQEAGQFKTQAGVFTFKTVFPLVEGSLSSPGASKASLAGLSELDFKKYNWKVVSFIPIKHYKSNGNERRVIAIYLIIILSVLFLYISILFSINQFYRKKAEDEIKDSEESYKNIFDNNPLPLCEEDWSKTKELLEQEKAKGITIDEEYFDENPEFFKKCMSSVKVIRVNQAFLDLFKYTTSAKIIDNINNIFNKRTIGTIKKELISIVYDEVSFKEEIEVLDSEKNSILAIIQFKKIGSYKKVIFSIIDITERKKAEEALKSREFDLRQIIDLVPHFIYVKDEDGKNLIVNQAIADAYGMTVEDIIHKPDFDNTPDKVNSKKYLNDDMEVINSGKQKFIPEEQITDSKGNIRFLETIKIPFNTSLTDKRAILGVSVDITQRKQLKEALVESNLRWQFAVDGSGLGIWDWKVSSGKVFYSKQWKNMLGFKEDEISDNLDEWEKRVHPDDIEKALSEINRHFEGKSSFYSSEHRLLCKDGTYKWFLDKGKIVEWTDENKVKRIIGTLTDISQMKDSELFAKREFAHFKKIMDINPAGIYIVDREYNIEYVNPAVKKDFGEVNGKKCYSYFHDSYEVCKWCKNKEVFAGKTVNWEFYAQKSNKYYQLFSAPITNPDGSVSKFEMLYDITKQKDNERELKKYAKTQEILFREVNHRVKNNLSAIIGLMLKERDSAKAKGFSHLKIFDDLIGRIYGLAAVHSLLSQSKWQPLLLGYLCEKIITGRLNDLPLNKKIEVDIQPNNVQVFVDSNQAHQLALVINELATNSIKYAMLNRNTAKINVTIEQTDKYISLVFSDDGPGFPQEILDGAIKSWGIGFDIINGIVTRTLGGNVKNENQNGAKTIITFKSKFMDKEREKDKGI